MDAALSSLSKGHRYPAEVISHCVWLCYRFPLRFREVEEMMLERSVAVSYETKCRRAESRAAVAAAMASGFGEYTDSDHTGPDQPIHGRWRPVTRSLTTGR